MLDENANWLRLVYICMAAFAGSITALSFLKWKEMTLLEIFITLFVGFSFAIFITPWAAHAIAGIDETEVRVIAGLTYLTASGSNSFLPILIRAGGRFADRMSGKGEAK